MFRTEYYHLQSKKIKSPVTFVMLADLHNHSFGENNEQLLSAISQIDPAFICIAGDMLIGNSKIPYQVAQETVVKLAENYPVYYGLGNHEARMMHDRHIYGERFEEYMKPLKLLGVKVLIDSSEKIQVGDNHFRIYGYDLPMKYFEKFNRYKFDTSQLKEALGPCEKKEDVYQILLAHNPVYFRQYAAWGADLTLSGHLHGGIIRLPLIGGVITPQAKLFPRYCAGKYTIDEKQMIISRGLGTHTVPFRFNNPEELSVIKLTSMK